MSFLIPKTDSRVIRFHHSSHDRPLLPADEAESINPIEPENDDEYKSRMSHKSDSSSVINFFPQWCACFDFLRRKKERKGEKVPCCRRCRNCWSCPPSGVLSRFILFFLISASFWFVIWGLDSDLAEDSISSLIILEILGMSFGIIVKLVGFPALLAPLIIGIVLNNIPQINFFTGLHHRGWIEPIREMALTIILTRAGLELSPKQMKKLKGIVPLAAFGPCIIEAMACAAIFYGIFQGQGVPVAMCFVAGFAIAAVSPAVVVPGMLSLKRKKFGVQEGIHTLLIAASSIDDVLAISAFSIALALVGKGTVEKGMEWTIYCGFLGIFVGVFQGFVVGIMLHFIPSRDIGKPLPYMRLLLLLLINFTSMFMYKIKVLSWLSGAGSLAVLCTSFFASFGWRSVPHWKHNFKKIETSLANVWTLCVPLLFGTIGKEINFREMSKHWDNVGKVIAVMFCALIIRCVFMFCITGFTKFNKKERLFCSLAWTPKATVQAALTPLVLSKFENSDDKNLRSHAQNVVTMAVLAILLTAPMGAVLINVTGPKLLRKAEIVPEEFPNGDEPEVFQDLVIAESTSKTSKDYNDKDSINQDDVLYKKASMSREEILRKTSDEMYTRPSIPSDESQGANNTVEVEYTTKTIMQNEDNKRKSLLKGDSTIMQNEDNKKNSLKGDSIENQQKRNSK